MDPPGFSQDPLWGSTPHVEAPCVVCVCMCVCGWNLAWSQGSANQRAVWGKHGCQEEPASSLHLRVASGFSFPFFWISGSFFWLEPFSSALSLPWSTRGFVFTGGNSSGSALLRTDATPNKVTETRPDTCCGACALESLCWFRTEPECRGTLMDH